MGTFVRWRDGRRRTYVEVEATSSWGPNMHGKKRKRKERGRWGWNRRAPERNGRRWWRQNRKK